mgnify:CR=1 FL=1
MPRFELVLPEGRVLLRNPETGETLTLSADSGPLVLGTVEMRFECAPRGLSVSMASPETGSSASTAASAVSTLAAAAPVEFSPAESAEPAESVSPADSLHAAELSASPSLPTLPLFRRGSGPRRDFPFSRPKCPLAFPAGVFGRSGGSGESEGSNGLSAKPHVRVLEAPLEALTESDFTTSLERFAASRNNLEEEIDFLTDIEGDPDDINELREALDALDERIRATAERFESWRAAEKKRDEERGAAN